MPVLHHVLLAAAATALGAAGLRVASLAAPRGLERVLAAATLAVAAAVGEALLLGLAGLGANSVALGLAAGLTWLAAWRLVPAPEVRASTELAAWWRGLDTPRRVAGGALAGAFLAWQVWLLRHPGLGFDTVLYHLSDAAVWAGSGHPGATELILRGLPVTNYPITDEVLLTWMMGLSRSLVPASLLVPPQVLLLGLAAWTGIRSLGLPRLAAGLSAAALCTLPAVIAWSSNGAMPDPAALAWLVTCAAMVAASRTRPALFAPAIVAAGLSVGTKTTTLPLTLVVLGIGLWIHRARLRALALPLLLALAAALGTGGVWYIRNLIDHGSPLWPFIKTPWGDPLPVSVQAANVSFLEAPRATLDAVGHLYVSRLLEGIVLLAAAFVIPLFVRRRAVLVASGVALVSLLIWARAPFTGAPPGPLLIPEGTFSTTRYLLPGIAAAVLALALAAGGRGLGARLAQVALAAGAAIGLVQSLRLGFPAAPSALVPLAGAVVGAAAALVLRRLPESRLAGWALVIAAGALLAWPASGYERRNADTDAFGAGVSRFVDSSGGDRPVWSAPLVVGTLTGDRLQRRLRPIPQDETCAALRARARTGWIVLWAPGASSPDVRALERCMAPRPADYSDHEFRAWRPSLSGA